MKSRAESLCVRKHCLCQEQRKIREKPILFTHDYLASLTHEPAPETYFKTQFKMPPTPSQTVSILQSQLTLAMQTSQKDSRDDLDLHLQCLLSLSSLAKQDPSVVKEALYKQKPRLQDLFASAEAEVKKKAAGLSVIAQLVPLWDFDVLEGLVDKPACFIDIASSGLDSKSYEILNSTMKLILSLIKQREKLLSILIDKTSYLQRVYLVLMSEKTDMVLAGQALEHLLTLISSKFGLGSPTATQAKFLEAIVGEIFDFTKSSTKKFAILAFTCLERLLHIIPVSSILTSEVDSYSSTIEDTFFAHPIEQIQIAAGKLFIQMLRKEVETLDNTTELVERALQHFNSKSHRLSGLYCDLLMVLVKNFKLTGKLVVDEILHLAVSSLEVMKSNSGGGVYVSYLRIFSLILECFKALSEKEYEVFVKTQGLDVTREMIETLQFMKEKEEVAEAIKAISYLVKHGKANIQLDGMEAALLNGVCEKILMNEWAKGEIEKEVNGLLEVCGAQSSPTVGNDGKIDI